MRNEAKRSDMKNIAKAKAKSKGYEARLVHPGLASRLNHY